VGLAFAAALSGVAAPAAPKEIRLTLKEGTNFSAARSPADGSFVLDLQGTLWRLPAEGGRATALTDGLGDDRLPDISKDGAALVFQSYRNGTWDIFRMNADGSSSEALTSGPADDREPVFSPDGNQVAFSSDRSGDYDIWILQMGTEEPRRLTSDPGQDYMPVWTPSGDEIVFVSERGVSGSPSLYRTKADGAGEAVRVLELEGRIASPSVSPDGKRVLFSVATPVPPETSRLATVPLAGGDASFLETPEDVFPFRPQWTQANEVAYTAAGALWRQRLEPRGEAAKIPLEAEVVLDRPSYSRRPVDFPKGRTREPVRGMVRPVVSGDHSVIAYAALGDLWLVSTEGGDPIPLTRDEALDSDPHWAPDGKSLVFASDRAGTMDLWVKDIEAPPIEGERRLTTSLGAELTPAWSPDGKRIAYLDHDSRLHLVGIQGEDDRVLTEARRGVGMPSWSSDSRHIALSVHVPISSRFREGYNRILVVDSETGSAKVLEEPGGSIGVRDGDGPIWRPDGGALAFAMDGGLWILPVSPNGDVAGKPAQIAGEVVDSPSWSGDGKRILYLGSEGLAELEVDTGAIRKIAVRHDHEIRSTDGRLLIRNVRVVDGTGAAARDGMDVAIEGNRIASIQPTSAEIPEDFRVVSGEGRTLIPGLIEMHAHLGLPAWGSGQGKVWLAYGVTSVRTPADALYRVLEERESIRSGRRLGPRIFYTGATFDGDRIYYTGALAIGDGEELEQEMKRALALEYDMVKTYVRLSDPLQKAAIEKAHAAGIFVTSHEVYPAVAYGVDGIEHLSGTSRRGFSPKLTQLRRTYQDVVELISRSGVYFTPTIGIQGGYALALAGEPDLLEREARFLALFPPFVQESFRSRPQTPDVATAQRLVAPLFATIDRIHEQGGRIVAGTDSPIIPYGLSLLLEIEQLSNAGLGPMAALESATRVAAEGLGAGDELGTIEPGKVADLVLLAGDPTEDIRNLRKTEMVVVNGRMLTVEQLLKR
jgi:Tol biopolymer transport system component/imidazolonepropionase-like amidohydrolase